VFEESVKDIDSEGLYEREGFEMTYYDTIKEVAMLDRVRELGEYAQRLTRELEKSKKMCVGLLQERDAIKELHQKVLDELGEEKKKNGWYAAVEDELEKQEKILGR